MPDEDDLPDEYLSEALSALRNIACGLRFAVIDARVASEALAGARAARADELLDMLTKAETHCQRLIFVCEAQTHSDQHQKDIAD